MPVLAVVALQIGLSQPCTLGHDVCVGEPDVLEVGVEQQERDARAAADLEYSLITEVGLPQPLIEREVPGIGQEGPVGDLEAVVADAVEDLLGEQVGQAVGAGFVHGSLR